MCDYDSDSEPIVDAWRRARKEHRCFACRETIRVGDSDHFTAQLDDGTFGSYKHCARCWAMLGAILKAGAVTAMYDLNCGVAWEEEFGPLPDEVAALAFLTPDEAQARAAKEKEGTCL